MAHIGNTSISVSPIADGFQFTVRYEALFSPEEVQSASEFADSLAIMEDDRGARFGGSDDLIQNEPIRSFFADSLLMDRQWVVRISRNKLDTEAGGEEIYAVVHFRPVDATQSQTKETARIDLAP